MRGLKLISLTIISILLFSASAFAESESSIASYKSSHLWSTSYDVKVAGHYAFYPKKYGLEIIDLSNPTMRPITARLMLSEHCTSIEISGSYAYLGHTGGGFYIVDISNPENPTVVNSYALEGFTRNITIIGDIAFVSQKDDGVYFIDISDPANLFLISSFVTAGDPHKVAVSDDLLYITEWGYGLEVVDISTPASPSLIGSFEGSGNSSGTKYWDIILNGNYAFITDYATNQGSDFGGFTVMDISDPTNPDIAFTDDLHHVNGLLLDGTTLYISTQTIGLFSYDVTNPATPVLLDQCMDQLFSNHLAILDNYLISSGRVNPYFDISDPSNIIATSFTELQTLVWNVFVNGDIAYIAHSHAGLTILNITDRANPVVISNIPTTGTAWEVEVIGQTAYVSNHAGLDIIDVSDPANPFLIGAFLDSEDTNCQEFSIVGNLAYITGYPYRAYIVDISDPANPALVGTYQPDYPDNLQMVESITPFGDYAYLCNTYISEVEILDISDPTTPTKVGIYTDIYQPVQTTFLGNYALISGNNTGTDILDVTDPANPIKVNHIDGDSQFKLGQFGDYLIFSDFTQGFDIYNFADVANPYYIGKFDTPGNAYGVKSDGEYIYVADVDGFLILTLNLPTYRAGDTNNDATVNVGDAVFMINFVFKDGAAPEPIEAGDVNCDSSSNVGDAVYLINYVFKNGPDPCYP